MPCLFGCLSVVCKSSVPHTSSLSTALTCSLLQAVGLFFQFIDCFNSMCSSCVLKRKATLLILGLYSLNLNPKHIFHSTDYSNTNFNYCRNNPRLFCNRAQWQIQGVNWGTIPTLHGHTQHFARTFTYVHMYEQRKSSSRASCDCATSCDIGAKACIFIIIFIN